VGNQERAETEAAAITVDKETGAIRMLRMATVGAGTWLATTAALVASGVIHENSVGIWWILSPMIATAGLGALSNAMNVQFIPNEIRRAWQTGIRDRLWNSRVGEWVAKKLGAPERSQLAGPSAFRATEAALGVAASELYEALPSDYRSQLAELPDILAMLEARASEARAEIEILGAMAPTKADAELLVARRQRAQKQLAESVAALEGIRLDLLRVHAGAQDLAPLTTLLDAARDIGVDLGRLADAQREVE
jgi:eukaryotic-like serine/threonine-protein kinase